MFDNNNITLLNREYVCTANGFAQVSIGDITITVEDDPFWQKFAKGWEPETERIYQAYVKPGSTVLDIGAWIGPTILYSLACGAEIIYAIEPNPQSYTILKHMIKLNPQIKNRVTLINKAVSSQSGSLNMGMAKDEDDTSMFGIQSHDSDFQGVQIEATTLRKLIQQHQLNNIDLIKIDIEGAEVLLHQDLQALSQQQQTIHLSIHVPFFPQTADKVAFANALKNFTVYDDRGETLSHDNLTDRLMTESSHPDWGTKHGNFFELLLLSKHTELN